MAHESRFPINPDVDNTVDHSLSHKFVLRISEKMRDDIHKAANVCKRSMNKEINARLEHSLFFYPNVPLIPRKLELKRLENNTSHDIELLVNQALKDKLAQLNLEHKRTLLKFLNAFI